MAVITGNVITLSNLEPGVTRIIPPQPKTNPFLAGLLQVLGIGLAVLIPALAPEEVILAETIGLGADLAFQELSARIGTGSDIDALTAFTSVLGGVGAIGSTVAASRALARTQSSISELAQVATDRGLSSLERQVLLENVEKSITEKLSAKAVSERLIRAGLTDTEVSENLRTAVEVLKRNGVNADRFESEVAFVNQETKIFQDLNESFNKFGLDINDVFDILDKSGIDVVGVNDTSQLVKAIRGNNAAVSELKGQELFTQLEGALERDLEPTLFTRVLNAKNAERGLNKVNKLLSLSRPDSLISEVTNKIFDPVKERIYSKTLEPLKKKTQQKLKGLIRQDLVRKQETKNGVYPCFSSSWINYLRAIPEGNGRYRVRVVFRKWGYKPVLITPPFTLQEIINWSESSSPGRIYHAFRKEYGGPKGEYQEGDIDAGFKGNVADIFNVLGFIPDKYISLGVSLIGNISSFRSVVSLNSWGDFFSNPAQYLERPLEDKGLEIVGGQAAKAVRDQAAGNRQAVQSYFQGKVTESTERRESEYRAASKAGRGKLDAVNGISGIIK